VSLLSSIVINNTPFRYRRAWNRIW